MRNLKKMLAAAMSAVLCAAGTTACADKKGGKVGAGEKTTAEVVQEMGIGINLGNTFESCSNWISSKEVKNYEVAWGSPVITQEAIQGYADAGFGVLRVPVAWSNMMQENYTIHPDYMARVKEVVKWALDAKLYVILNIHYDGGWWTDFADADKKDDCMTKYTRIWEQISESFKDEDYHLMFESLNEEGCWDSLWNRYSGNTNGKSEAYGLLNEINQKFVDTVRAGGGNNKTRHLLIAGYATDIELTCDAEFKMPNDPENRCAVSVHYYTPATFCILEEDANWGKMQTNWGSPTDQALLRNNMDLVKTTFADKGIPVIIGEYGATRVARTEEVVHLYLTSVCKAALERGMCPVLWDTASSQVYDRSQATFTDQTLIDQLNAAKAELTGEPQTTDAAA